MRNTLFYIFLFFKGLCIGAAGILLGVSGGSMAMLLGVYQELVYSIGALDRQAARMLRDRELHAFWKKINGNFLFSIVAGIVAGILVLRPPLRTLYEHYPIFISSFFFSLVIIASLLLLRKITRWRFGILLCFFSGIAFSYFMTRSSPFVTDDNLVFAAIGGFFAGATFIVPGVSGAFILMFIGKYQYILTSFGSLDAGVIILFVIGGILGVLIFARFITGLLKDYYNPTVAVFAGLMIGSLNKIWPWREVYEYATTIHGKRIPAFDDSILPWRYLQVTGKDPQVIYAILMMAAGVFMVVLVEKIGARLKTRS